MPACTTTPFLHQNKPSRESIFCGKVSGWWTKKPLFVLKFLPKTIQNDCAAYMCMGNGTEDPQAYNRQRKRMQGMQLMANGAASWKRRSNLDFGSVLFSVKVFFGLSVTPYSFTPYYLLFSVKAFFGLPVTPYSYTPYYLLFSIKAFFGLPLTPLLLTTCCLAKSIFGLPVTPYSFTPYYLLFSIKAFFGLPVTPYSLLLYSLLPIVYRKSIFGITSYSLLLYSLLPVVWRKSIFWIISYSLLLYSLLPIV